MIHPQSDKVVGCSREMGAGIGGMVGVRIPLRLYPAINCGMDPEEETIYPDCARITWVA